MENEKQKLAQEFVDEVMSGKYPNIEIDENGYIDHYGSKYKLIVRGNGKILVDYKTTALFWINAILTGVFAFLMVTFIKGGLFADTMHASLRNTLAIICGWCILPSLSLNMYIGSKQIQFQRYINDKFKRSKNQNSD